MSNLNKLVGKLLVDEKVTGLEAIILLAGQFDPIQCVLCEYEYDPYPCKQSKEFSEGEKGNESKEESKEESIPSHLEPYEGDILPPNSDLKKAEWIKLLEEMLKKRDLEKEQRERQKKFNEDLLKSLPRFVPNDTTSPWDLPTYPSPTPNLPQFPQFPDYPQFPNYPPSSCNACRNSGVCNCILSQPFITCSTNTTGK